MIWTSNRLLPRYTNSIPKPPRDLNTKTLKAPNALLVPKSAQDEGTSRKFKNCYDVVAKEQVLKFGRLVVVSTSAFSIVCGISAVAAAGIA
jgi:hypothetical protein